MKKWLRLWLIEKLGGYPDAVSAVSDVDSEAERKELLTQAVKKYFNAVGADDILREKGGEWIFEGKPLVPGAKEQAMADAVALLDSQLWKVLVADAKYQANRKMFIESRDEHDMVAGKLMVFLTDVLKTRLHSMAKGSGIYHTKEEQKQR